MYCSISEAFDDVSTPNNIPTSGIPPFFNTQGTYNENADVPICGTPIRDITKNDTEKRKKCYFRDERAINHDFFVNKFLKGFATHKFDCSSSIGSDYSSMTDNSASQGIYEHIYKCKICKKKINKKLLKMNYDNFAKKKEEQVNNSKNNKNLQEDNNGNKSEESNNLFVDKISKYEMKEITIMVLIGLLFIFVVDSAIRMLNK